MLGRFASRTRPTWGCPSRYHHSGHHGRSRSSNVHSPCRQLVCVLFFVMCERVMLTSWLMSTLQLQRISQQELIVSHLLEHTKGPLVCTAICASVAAGLLGVSSGRQFEQVRIEYLVLVVVNGYILGVGV